MQDINTLWEKVKNLSDEEWQRLRCRRDLIQNRAAQKPDWRRFVNLFSSEDLEQMKDAITSECERINPDDWD